jgi:predicted nucleic acid-binding protein
MSSEEPSHNPEVEASSASPAGAAPSQTIYILDSFALLAFLEGENSTQVVEGILHEAEQGQCQAAMSLINLGEVAYITEREQGLPQAQAVLAAVQQLPLQIIPADQDAVFAAAHIKAHHRLSFADAFAAAAAQESGGVLITGDPEFRSVSDLIQIHWLPR